MLNVINLIILLQLHYNYNWLCMYFLVEDGLNLWNHSIRWDSLQAKIKTWCGLWLSSIYPHQASHEINAGTKKRFKSLDAINLCSFKHLRTDHSVIYMNDHKMIWLMKTHSTKWPPGRWYKTSRQTSWDSWQKMSLIIYMLILLLSRGYDSVVLTLSFYMCIRKLFHHSHCYPFLHYFDTANCCADYNAWFYCLFYSFWSDIIRLTGWRRR